MTAMGNTTVYFAFGANRVLIRDVETGATLDDVPVVAIRDRRFLAAGRAAQTIPEATLRYPFAASALPVTDFEAADAFVRALMPKIRGFAVRKPRLWLHPLDWSRESIHDAERDNLFQVVRAVGAHSVAVSFGTPALPTDPTPDAAAFIELARGSLWDWLSP